MNREFQIRIENQDGHLIDCLCYINLAEANEVYTRILHEETEGQEYRLELLEVLQQDTVRTSPVEPDLRNLFANQGGAS